jgi:serine/threonine-protein kinase
MRARACPHDDRLRQLLDGLLGAFDLEALTAHLDKCAPCRRRLDALAGAPGTWHGVAEKLRPGPGENGPALRAVLADLRHEPEAQPDNPGPSALPARVGPYEVEALVGRGGMGRVYRAFDPKLRRVVAIKLLTESLAAEPSARNRFKREARVAANIAHEHVVTIHGVDEEDGQPYLVMQYVDGESLQARLDRVGALRLREVLCIGMQTAAGLAAAHAQGVVHRDVKPGNILLENGVERVKITDFGLARAVDDVLATSTGTIMGTPSYMSPEQARGEPVDHRSDLFSLGSVLYTMCTGERAFRGGSGLSVLRRVCDEEPRPIHRINPEVPEWFEAIVARLMAKEPADRFQSAAEVADLLSRHLAHLQQPAAMPLPEPLDAILVEEQAPPAPAVAAPPRSAGEARARGILGVLVTVALTFLGMGMIGSGEFDKVWPIWIAAAGFVGLLPWVWTRRAAARQPGNTVLARRRRLLLRLCLFALVGGLGLMIVGGPHRAHDLFTVVWPVVVLLYIAVPFALLSWAFYRPGSRRGYVVAALVTLLLLALSLLPLFAAARRAKGGWHGPPGQGGLSLVVHDPALKITVEGDRIKPHKLSGASSRRLNLPPGKYTVTATRDGVVIFEDEVEVLRGSHTPVYISQWGWVRFFPSDVEVQLDGKGPRLRYDPRQRADALVRVGRHRWVAYRAGQAIAKGEFVLRPDERKVIQVLAAKDDKAKQRDARQTAEAFLDAVLAARLKEAAALAQPGQAPSREEKLREFARLAGQKPTIATLTVERDHALATTTPVKLGDREGPLLIRMVKKDGRWLVREVDHATAAPGKEKDKPGPEAEE